MSITNEEFRNLNSDITGYDNITNLYKSCNEFNFDTFEYTSNKDSHYDIVDSGSQFERSKFCNSCEYYNDSEFRVKFDNIQGFSIIHFNCRSARNNFEKIESYLTNLDYLFDVIVLTETWLDDEEFKNYSLFGYDGYHCARKRKKGGGVAIYVNANLKSNESEISEEDVTDLNIENLCEMLKVEVTLTDNKKINILGIYKPPDTNVLDFVNMLECMINGMENRKSYICGDFNIDLLSYDVNHNSKNFVDMMFSAGYYPLINKPTRITNISTTIIDNIFTSDIEFSKQSGLLVNDISDHLPVFQITKNYYKIDNDNQEIEKRLIKEKNIQNLLNDLEIVNWEFVTNQQNPNIAYECFLNKFLEIFNKNCPIRKYNVNRMKKKQPWLTLGLIKASKKKNILYQKFLTNRNNETEKIYKDYKNKFTSIVRKAKKDYINKLLLINKSNAKQTWKILNNIINKKKSINKFPERFIESGKVLTTNNDIVNGFNKYFTSIGPELSNNIPKCKDYNFKKYMKTPMLNSIFLDDVSENEIINMVNLSKSKTSFGYDGISMQIVKYIIKVIAKPLAYITNISFKNGIFPDNMKTAKVIPVFKSGDKNVFTNYRPISLLPQFSKIIERMFNNRIVSFIEKMQIFHNSQYGFRSNHSTLMALTEYIENITDAIDNSKCSISVFIDLKKAFDTIDHSILLDKLNYYGIRGLANKWIRSYLSNRYQYVVINNSHSENRKIVCGVPQGSILGPTLFLLYINDIVCASKSSKFILFADDTTIYYNGNNEKETIQIINNDLKELNLWFQLNKLSLNVSKTKFMIFNRKIKEKENNSETSSICINNMPIQKVSSIKFLGVYIDCNLSWKDHINYIEGKIARNIGILNRNKNILKTNTLYSLYCTLILPYFQYCCTIWGNNYKCRIEKLQKLQKKCIRIICKVKYKENTNPLFLKLKTLKLIDIIEFNNVNIVYRAYVMSLPLNIQCFFEVKEHSYSTRNQSKFAVKYARTNYKSMCVTIKGVKLWNAIDFNIQNCNTVYQFRKKYKRNLLLKYQ